MINTNDAEPSAKADFTVVGISGRFRTLSMLEWKYIFNGKNDRSRTASVCGITGKVVAPDDFSGTLADSYDSAKWAVAESQGVVFFPVAGSRFDTGIWKTGSYGIPSQFHSSRHRRNGIATYSYGRQPCIIFSMICGCFAIPEAMIQS